jgi:outer membrane protein W
MARIGLTLCVLALAAAPASAQEDGRLFAGGLVGVSTLSADARTVTQGSSAEISLYKPENGLAVNLFAGYHLARFVSVQANYMFNRNDLTLMSSFLTPEGGGFYEQARGSAQHAAVADLLLYFRPLGSGIRPYLGTGLCLVRFSSRDDGQTASTHVVAPPGEISETAIALRSHVGIDMKLSRHVSFRYSFSETLGRNPISRHLTPAGERGLANFQNLFGFVANF